MDVWEGKGKKGSRERDHKGMKRFFCAHARGISFWGKGKKRGGRQRSVRSICHDPAKDSIQFWATRVPPSWFYQNLPEFGRGEWISTLARS